MISETLTLADFGWNPFFSSQIDLVDSSTAIPARVVAVHRDRLHVVGPAVDTFVPPFMENESDEESVATVGDWLLLDLPMTRARRLLRRHSLFKRRAAGTGRKLQLIAANVNTLFIVSSCNQDFNPARLERYLALAREARVLPVVVLTKADLARAPEEFARTARKLLTELVVETLDARDSNMAASLMSWCARGDTVALVGSSGVGKSTLINTLTAAQSAITHTIREKDDKGRHTTTSRALHRLPTGGWFVDTPGMREIQLTDVASGLDDVFAEVAAIAANCRFRDCRHQSEPGCAINAAVLAGTLDAGRVKRWRKLLAEEAHNNATLAERHARAREFGKLARRTQAEKASRRKLGD
ncbi:MAG TPA: ribosome small subunit-dependent GTPase A [Steroidobacteraceae bacterium]